jgi:hypothetical protein
MSLHATISKLDQTDGSARQIHDVYESQFPNIFNRTAIESANAELPKVFKMAKKFDPKKSPSKSKIANNTFLSPKRAVGFPNH